MVRTALARGIRKRCPHCGQGRLFARWGEHIPKCPVCGLVYERNPGDTWAFTVIGDRIPVAIIIVLIYFGIFRQNHALGFGVIALFTVFLVWTAPNRWGVGIALHYVSRRYWPDPADPIPGAVAGSEERP